MQKLSNNSNKLTDPKDIKKYIINEWKDSSGERIAVMLKKYWKVKHDPIKDIFGDVIK